MNWNFTLGQSGESVDVTISSLAEQAVAIEHLLAEFGELQKKFIAYAAPARMLP